MAPGSDDVPRAVARGGPLDGSVLGDAAAGVFEIVMADGSQHRYVATDEWGGSASGARTRAYAWQGRRGTPPRP
ncbi:hypothetical protein [Blastococcus sp. SYSU DS0619]